jgi:hypothetical protein
VPQMTTSAASSSAAIASRQYTQRCALVNAYPCTQDTLTVSRLGRRGSPRQVSLRERQEEPRCRDPEGSQRDPGAAAHGEVKVHDQARGRPSRTTRYWRPTDTPRNLLAPYCRIHRPAVPPAS